MCRTKNKKRNEKVVLIISCIFPLLQMFNLLLCCLPKFSDCCLGYSGFFECIWFMRIRFCKTNQNTREIKEYCRKLKKIETALLLFFIVSTESYQCRTVLPNSAFLFITSRFLLLFCDNAKVKDR